jgi:3-methylcrotonyl-CoA carboxylase beta subunit
MKMISESDLSMEKIVSKIDTTSPEFTGRQKQYEDIVRDWRSQIQRIADRDQEPAMVKHRERGKLSARRRVTLLIDPGTPFLELSALAANGQYNDQFPSAGIITGIGIIHGKPTVIVANDATVKGGTYVKETLKKHIRAQEIARQNHLACVYLVDSGGIFLPEQAELFPDRTHFGRIFYNQAQMSAAGIPQISVVMGSCTAGGAYVPAMSDQTIMVRNQGTIFIGGPPLVRAATGEEVTAEELGGAEVHTSISGVADHLAADDADALRICRSIFETLPMVNPDYPKGSSGQNIEQSDPEDPLYSIEELYGLAPVDLKKPVEVLEIIARLTDGSRFQEFKENYGTTIIAGFAKLHGYPIGIIANNGFLTSEASLKAAHFIELCNFRRIPLLFLQNITGFVVGKKYEHEGIARNGAKMIHAVATATVPKFTVVIGGSYGAGNYAMAGRAYDPHFLFMWPNARIGVMGGEQASFVLSNIRQDKSNPKEPSLVEQFKEQSTSLYSTSRIWDDGIIDPAETRNILALTISLSMHKKWESPQSGIYRM